MDKNRRRNAQKIIVAMSGGIDSSVAAALLKRAGFEVVGVFMKFWSEFKKDGLISGWNKCCSPEAEKRARQVAKKLSIPFYALNFEGEFKKRIVDDFLKEYKAGRTPNPCVVCNKEIKFGLLLEKAFKIDTDYLATGHYARLEKGRLFKGKDREKDQSYFLWQLSQEQLRHAFFPVGQYTKKEVRLLAKGFNLPVLDSPESQEICFIQTTINDFLSRQIKQKPGQIVDIKGKTLGQHQGLAFYTIGQRKGIRLPGGPFYVLDKNPKKNSLIITKNEKDLLRKELIARNINWIFGEIPGLPLKVKVKIRYRHRETKATLRPFAGQNVKIIFDKPQRAITPGQSVVFYQGEELLGGGMVC